MLNRFMNLCALAALVAMTALVADVQGQWTAAKPTQILTLKSDGTKLTGTVQSHMGSLRISEVKVDGDNIKLTLYVILTGGNDPLGLAGYDAYAEEGQVRELTYQGTITGDEIKFKITQEGLEEARNVTFKKNIT